jgi:hypothetical protein
MTETTYPKDIPQDFKLDYVKRECSNLLHKSDMTEPKYYKDIIEELKSNFGYLYKSENVTSYNSEKTVPPSWWNQKLVALLRYMGYNANLKNYLSISNVKIDKMIDGSCILTEILTTYILEVSCV